MRLFRRGVAPLALTAALLVPFGPAPLPALAAEDAPVAYRLSFPAPEHRWMQVEITLTDVPAGPLRLRMSRSSPGRYALHEFSKNVYDVRITDAGGRALDVQHPAPNAWDVAAPPGVVKVAYKIFGDRIDGTYLAVDPTHAHINMPAALMWARGFERRAATLRFERPSNTAWRVATQLLPGTDAQTFTAPNLQYLMDSPTEVGTFALRTFTVPDGKRSPTFRLALHHEGTDAELDALAHDTETIVREARAVFGVFPAFEGNTYTFIADYLPWAAGDGMEHRNSTILTSSNSLAQARDAILGTVAHEFFHSWNVERIRPRSLEPFDFEDANVSGELWMAEGVTNYYGPLVLRRAGLIGVEEYASTLAAAINTVTLSPGRKVRSAEEMSRMAPLVDAASAIDRTNFENTYISYYTWGEAIGLALDLSLRDRTDGRVTLDHFMRALWQKFGVSAERVPGYVEQPYTMTDLEHLLATVSGDAAFAGDFFNRFIQGHDVADYGRLLARGGLVLRPRHPGVASAGDLRLQAAGGHTRIAGYVAAGSPAYDAGLERDDVITAVAGSRINGPDDFETAVRRQKPGTAVPIVFLRRGAETTATLRLIEDPRQDVVTAEMAGLPLTDAQRRFRQAWLSPERPAF